MIPIPYQFVLRAYTEGLSRVPSPTELVTAHGALSPQGCTYNSVNVYSAAILLSPEAMSQPLNKRERVQTAYRLLLNRDPDRGGWDYFTTLPFPTAIASIQQSPEYKRHVLALCTGKAVGFGNVPMDATTSDAVLRHQLATAAPGTIITISGRIAVSSPLVIPTGVTLQGKPGHYATSAHLLRSTAFTGPLVYVGANARLTDVTVDGRRTDVGYNVNATNIEIIGSGAMVSRVRSQNPSGWTALFCSPHFGPINNITITENTMIGYGTSRKIVNGWADGISIACDSAYVASNKVIDMTDVAIISFDPYDHGVSHIVYDNYVLNTVDTWSMMGIDQQQGFKNFGNSLYAGNQLFTAGNAKARIGVINGASPWAGDRGAMVSPVYSGNYGYVLYELYGLGTDGGHVDLPSVGFVSVGAKVKSPCVGSRIATTGIYNCLMSVAE